MSDRQLRPRAFKSSHNVRLSEEQDDGSVLDSIQLQLLSERSPPAKFAIMSDHSATPTDPPFSVPAAHLSPEPLSSHPIIPRAPTHDKVRPVFVRGVVGNREIPKPTVGGAARVDTEVQRA